MINRVLIRIKVVQLLYSYLLTEKQFMLESRPTAPTKEKRFAYDLYLDILALMVKISSKVERRGMGTPLANTRFIEKVKSDDKMRSLLNRYDIEYFPFQDAVEPLAGAVKESGIFKRFVKLVENGDPTSDSVWHDLFNVIISPSKEYNDAVEKRENYSMRGVERMQEMMKQTFVNFLATRDNLDDLLTQLRKSLAMGRELYLRLLALPMDLTFLRAQKIDNARHKYILTDEDINPNMRFVENQLVETLRNDGRVADEMAKANVSWLPDDRQLLEVLLKEIMDSDLYKEYMEFPVTDFNTDCEFWRNVMKHIILPSEAFLGYLEDKSVFWNDDLEIIGTFVLKTLKRIEEGRTESAFLSMFKDDEDSRFGPELTTKVITNKDKYRSLINEAVSGKSWESERLAFMDVVIIMTALAEITGFPKIPLNVSINEYIEMAKCYSTSKSGNFVHGVLSNIVAHLQEKGELLKR